MAWHTWLIYFVAALGLSLSPGPNGLLALTHGALHGRRKTLFTVAGGALGFATVIALSMFGIGALLQASLVWLTVLKWVGGGYLVWLGVQVWRAPPIAALALQPQGEVNGWSLFRQGALSALTNPKGILFFAAFLPQFIDPARSLLLQYFIMAGTFVAIEFITEVLIASMAQRISGWLARVGRGFNRVCGGIFAAIGVALPLRA
ncbi:MAG: LysE family transporter [Rubrivivax sp.]|uniref:LysE family translocator n=1 Tax=Ottowia sp. TaxID=1898956 RepID=UPI00217BAC93|nr:LysE family transporter [Ottowia sp.]MCC6813238.1 LysE family transporter [Rubrivivax sp.]MCZ2089039.1 LysE family transporter [Burkholderiales bacterium]HNE59372.1 LysE family transporter [Ottowia sp.]HNI83963.1 LysE family transporter [Ottowia sp.]HNJ44703.1 LysE family transporter [Ottowia sp.]